MCGCVTQNCNCGAPAPMPTCNIIAICLTVIIGIVFVGLFVLAIINEIKNKNHCKELEAKQKYDSEVLLLAMKYSCNAKTNDTSAGASHTVNYTHNYEKYFWSGKTVATTSLEINCKGGEGTGECSFPSTPQGSTSGSITIINNNGGNTSVGDPDIQVQIVEDDCCSTSVDGSDERKGDNGDVNNGVKTDN